MLRQAPALSQAPSSFPPAVLIRCTVVTAAEDAAAAPGNHVKFEPGDIVRRRARGAAGNLADHGTAVAVLPGRSGIVTADGLAFGQQCRDRLAERPGQLAVGAGLAFVDLRAFGVHAEHDGFARRRNGAGKRWFGGGCAHQRTRQQQQGERKSL